MNKIYKILLLFALCLLSEAARRNPTTPSPRCSVATQLPCGTFIQYKNHSEVEEFGFAAGLYLDGSTAYVGIGYNAGCQQEFNTPARLKVSGHNPGAYMSCTNEHYDTTILRYLMAHPNLKWVPFAGATALRNQADLVYIDSPKFRFYFGRKQSGSHNGKPTYIVSKVYDNAQMNWSNGRGYHETFDVEVISC